MADTTARDKLRLARSEGIGPVNYRRLLGQYPSPAAALDALPERARKAGRTSPLRIPSAEAAQAELENTQALGGRILLLGDPDYPPLLACLPDAPPVLSILGNPARLRARGIGVVGARNASAAGLRLAEALSGELAATGLVIISGLARGIDAAAHRASLHQGRTVAAIAGGLDRIYPPEHADLQGRIAENGCVVTEAPLGTIPTSPHFPRRNRLIAGLGLGCLVVEAALKSGTLITAEYAARYGRTVFAIPGSPLDPRARGCNALLRQPDTILTETARDILDALPGPERFLTPVPFGFSEPQSAFGTAPIDLDDAITTLRQLLTVVPVSVDEVAIRCQFSISMVLAGLAELELGGFARFLPGGMVAAEPPP